MISAWWIVSLVLLGASPPAEAEQVSYEVRVIDAPAAEWRGQLYRHCARIGRDGRSTVWTIDDAKVADLLRCVAGNPRSNIVQAPKVTVQGQAPALLINRTPRSFVVDVDRVAEGPVDHSPSLAFQPSVDSIDEGWTVKIRGHRSDKGIRTHVNIDSTWIGNVATAMTREAVENKQFGRSLLAVALELPQVVEARIDGDFEVPTGKMLLVSLGTATTLDGRKRPIVMERLALIAARRVIPEAEEVSVVAPVEDGAVRAASATRPVVAPRATPPIPSRTLLPAIGPDGKPVTLPPLPDDNVTPAALTGPTVPLASPQSRMAGPVSRFDPNLAPARFEPAPIGASTIHLDGAGIAGGRSKSMRIPLGGRLSIELDVKVVPSDQPE